MRKERNYEQYSEIIKDYLNDNHDENSGTQLRKSFAEWYFDKHDFEARERVAAELDIFEQDDIPEVMNRQQIEALVEKLAAMRNGESTVKDRGVRRRLIPAWAKVAAVLLPLIVLAGVWKLITDNPQQDYVPFIAAYEVPYGKMQEQTLEDNTQVILNSGSRLTVNHDNTRRVAELSGESYFDVTRDEERPFVVQTRDLTVTVLGTKFSVEAYPESEQTKVILVSGKVRLETQDGESWELTPNQKFIYNRVSGTGEIIELQNELVAKECGWITGNINLTDASLSDIFHTIERRWNVRVEVGEGVDVAYKCTFMLNANSSLNEALEVAKVVTGAFDYKIKGDKITIIKPE